MMRAPVYIAAPYGAGSESEIRRNVARAVALGRLAASLGLAPIVPHAIGWLGVHGTRDESDMGARVIAIESGCAIASLVGTGGGLLWLLARPDGTLSPGCMSERAAYWQSYRSMFGEDPPESLILRRRWEGWGADLRRFGIEVSDG
jgi:hypothetical protein